VDETYDDYAIGRYYGQAPHIDSICRISNCTTHTGRFIQTKVIGRDGYDFLVEQIGKK